MKAAATVQTRSATRALTSAQLRELEADLRAERRRLERSLGADVGHAVERPDAGHARAGAADVNDRLAVALQTRAHARHEAVLDALRRIEEGAYGRCTRCGAAIPYGRLLVMPESVHCVTCGAHA